MSATTIFVCGHSATLKVSGGDVDARRLQMLLRQRHASLRMLSSLKKLLSYETKRGSESASEIWIERDRARAKREGRTSSSTSN